MFIQCSSQKRIPPSRPSFSRHAECSRKTHERTNQLLATPPLSSDVTPLRDSDERWVKANEMTRQEPRDSEGAIAKDAHTRNMSLCHRPIRGCGVQERQCLHDTTWVSASRSRRFRPALDGLEKHSLASPTLPQRCRSQVRIASQLTPMVTKKGRVGPFGGPSSSSSSSRQAPSPQATHERHHFHNRLSGSESGPAWPSTS